MREKRGRKRIRNAYFAFVSLNHPLTSILDDQFSGLGMTAHTESNSIDRTKGRANDVFRHNHSKYKGCTM